MKKESTLTNPKEVFVGKPTFYKRVAIFRIGLIAVIFGLVVLTVLVKQYDYFGLDLTVTQFIQSIDQPGFDFLMRTVSTTGNMMFTSVVLVICALTLLIIKKIKASTMLIVSTGGVGMISELVKWLIARPRPSALLIHQIGLYPKSDSFPSGHVLLATGLYGFLLYLTYTQLKQQLTLRVVLLVVVSLPLVLMGLSRIYLGAHWVSDVIGAYLLGYIWLFVVIHIYNALGPKVKPG